MNVKVCSQIISKSNAFSCRIDLSEACHQLLQDDLQEEAGQEEHLPAVHAGGDADLHDGLHGREVLPVHVHQEDVPVGDGHLLLLRHDQNHHLQHWHLCHHAHLSLLQC